MPEVRPITIKYLNCWLRTVPMWIWWMLMESHYYMMWRKMVGPFLYIKNEYNFIRGNEWKFNCCTHPLLGFDKVAELIFKNGGSKTVNHKSGGDETPLCFVAYNGGYPEGHDEIAELIIQNGADVNLRCRQERTALHLAAIKGDSFNTRFTFLIFFLQN